MKINQTKEWWLSLADSEGTDAVGAGFASLSREQETEAFGMLAPPVDDARIAFAKLVELMRRRARLSVQQLALKASLEVNDIVGIEEGRGQLPEPRTVFRLAQIFKLPEQQLMQLAGLAVANDQGLRQEAVRFAARSASMQQLTKEENAALEAFIAVLSRQEPKKPK